MTEKTAGPRKGLIRRLRERLNRGDSWLTCDLAQLLPGGRIEPSTLEELETRLLLADVGVETTQKIIGGLERRLARSERKDLESLRGALASAIREILDPVGIPLELRRRPEPFVIMLVGVNGSGKTTTAAKLAVRATGQGLKVLLAAADTFRAAAIEQLQVWGERHGVPVIAQQRGADPAAVAYDALAAARARGAQLLIADTAGRLHTQAGLMEELRKVKRVMTKLDPQAPHEVLLVLDASIGQNSLVQARQFHQALGVTGIVMTKLDGSAKGGVLLALADQLGLPVRYIGIGESADDLVEFDPAAFVTALLE